jgi:ABC-type transport system involved in multi-copper enzyme maturation permease subunit
MKTFAFILPDERSRSYQWVTMLILLMNALVFGFILLNESLDRNRNLAFFGVSISVLSLILFMLKTYTGFRYSHRPEITMIILALVWMILGFYLPGACMLCLSVLGFYTPKVKLLQFSKDGVRYPSFPVRLFRWQEIENVILKDDALTIDFKNNKMLQSTVKQYDDEGFTESDFNEFCRDCLLASGLS